MTKESEEEEAVVAARSLDSAGSIADLTAADEHLRNLAEAIGGNNRAESNFNNADMTREMMM